MTSSPHAGKSAAAAPGPLPVGAYLKAAAGVSLKRETVLLRNLAASWPAIAGAHLARHAQPVKLTNAGAPSGGHPRCAAQTLHLEVSPAAALEVQYAVPQLIGRINRALGFDAVCAVRILQAPVRSKANTPLGPAPLPAAKKDRLSAALGRIAAGVEAAAAAPR